jgi:hypothetical protein
MEERMKKVAHPHGSSAKEPRRDGGLTRAHLGGRVGPTHQWVADSGSPPRWMR